MASFPTIQIFGTSFFIDGTNEVFQQVDHPSNTICFGKIILNPDYCLIHFDKVTKNVFNGTTEQADALGDEKVEWVRLPAMEKMDPFGKFTLKLYASSSLYRFFAPKTSPDHEHTSRPNRRHKHR